MALGTVSQEPPSTRFLHSLVWNSLYPVGPPLGCAGYWLSQQPYMGLIETQDAKMADTSSLEGQAGALLGSLSPSGPVSITGPSSTDVQGAGPKGHSR